MMWRQWERLNSFAFRKICGRNISETLISSGTSWELIKMFACSPENVRAMKSCLFKTQKDAVKMFRLHINMSNCCGL